MLLTRNGKTINITGTTNCSIAFDDVRDQIECEQRKLML